VSPAGPPEHARFKIATATVDGDKVV